MALIFILILHTVISAWLIKESRFFRIPSKSESSEIHLKEPPQTAIISKEQKIIYLPESHTDFIITPSPWAIAYFFIGVALILLCHFRFLSAL